MMHQASAWHRPRRYVLSSSPEAAPSTPCAPSRSLNICLELRLLWWWPSALRSDNLTSDGFVRAYEQEHDVDISGLLEESTCVSNTRLPSGRDTALIPVTRRVFGYFYHIDTRELQKVVQDRAKIANRRKIKSAPWES
jgi:hypothetical protein